MDFKKNHSFIHFRFILSQLVKTFERKSHICLFKYSFFVHFAAPCILPPATAVPLVPSSSPS